MQIPMLTGRPVNIGIPGQLDWNPHFMKNRFSYSIFSFSAYCIASGLIGGLSAFAFVPVPEKVKSAKEAIYELSEEKDDNQRFDGLQYLGKNSIKRSTAFFISHDIAVTTTNGVLEEFVTKVMEDPDKPRNLFLRNGENKIEVKEIVAFSYMEGLALLRVDGYKGPYLEIADSLKANAKLFMAGYIGGMIGIYQQAGKLEKYEHLMAMPINDSFENLDPASLWGGPILDREGEVVGVNAINKISYNVAFAVDLDLLNRFLEKGKNCERVDVEECVFDSSVQLIDNENQEDRYAQYVMGMLLINSFKHMDDTDDTILRDSFKWIEKSAEQDYAPAQFILCMMYYYGRGVDKNFEPAFYWCKRSAEQRFLLARHMLGLIYIKGPPGIRDREQSMLFMGMSAQQGLSYAQLYIGLFWFLGENVKQNAEIAFYWFSKSVENGLDLAKNWLHKYKLLTMPYLPEYADQRNHVLEKLILDVKMAYHKFLGTRRP